MSTDGDRVTVGSWPTRPLKMVGDIVESRGHPVVTSWGSEMISCIFTIIFPFVKKSSIHVMILPDMGDKGVQHGKMINALECLVQIHEGDKHWFDYFWAFPGADLSW